MKPKSKQEYLYLLYTENTDGLNYEKASSKTKKFFKRFLSKARRRTDKEVIKNETR